MNIMDKFVESLRKHKHIRLLSINCYYFNFNGLQKIIDGVVEYIFTEFN